MFKKLFRFGKKKEEKLEKEEAERLEREKLEAEGELQEENEEKSQDLEKIKREEAKAKEIEEKQRKEAEEKLKLEEKRQTEEKNAKEAAEKEELNRIAKEKEEKQRLEAIAKEEAERLEKEKAEKERLEKLEKEKEEQEKAELEAKKLEEEQEKEVEKEKAPKKRGFFKSLKEKLTKTREGLFGKVKTLFSSRSIIDEDLYEELEDLLIQSDIGMDMTLKIVGELEKEVKKRGIKDPNLVYDVLKDVMEGFLIAEGTTIDTSKANMNVILVVGVNGVGKTTTIGKLASKYVKDGKKVVIGAADTFRAAAIEQVEEWANRSGADIIRHEQGSDPGAVVFDTLKAAENRGADVVIIDTAGRLHNKNNLMKELEKINTIIEKSVGKDGYESLLVIDGTTGQNGLNQAKVFNEVTNLTGFIVTKLDGTAKGGIVFAISEELKRPIKLIGVGEGIEDLREFNAKEYINAIFV